MVLWGQHNSCMYLLLYLIKKQVVFSIRSDRSLQGQLFWGLRVDATWPCDQSAGEVEEEEATIGSTALLRVRSWGRGSRWRVHKCCPCTGHSHSHSQYERINVRMGFCLKNPDPQVKASCCQHSGNNKNVQRCSFEPSLYLHVCLRLNREIHGNIHTQPWSIEEDSEVQ